MNVSTYEERNHMTLIQSPTIADVPTRIAAASKRPTLGPTPAGVISLAQGEPDADTPAAIVDAAVTALRRGRTRYAPATGEPSLRNKLAEHLSESTGAAIDPADIGVTHGANAAIAATILALVRPGDRVLVPEPTYSLYVDHIAMVGAETVWVPAGADGRIDVNAIRAVASGARMLILCSPSNPTGQVLNDDELAGIAEILRSAPDLVLVSDEAYCDIVYDRPFRSALTLQDVVDQVVTIGTFSKSYAMTGWRLGWTVSPGHAEAINLVHRTLTGSLNTFVQDAALVALDTSRQALDDQVAVYRRRRDLVVEAFRAMPGVSIDVPEGAFYAFPRIDTPLASNEIMARLRDAGVLVRSGLEYGPSGAGFVRISYATDDAALREGLRRFAEVVAKIRSS